MPFNFQSIAYQAKVALAEAGISMRHSHILEVCSALCGYASYSAYTSTGHASVLDEAEHIVLDTTYAQTRSLKLGIPAENAEMATTIVADHMKRDAILSELPPKVYSGVIR